MNGATATMPSATCPPWCDPQECTARLRSTGVHASSVLRIAAVDSEPCTVAVSLRGTADRRLTMAVVEVQHDPDMSRALGMDPEPDELVYSLGQARQLSWALRRLLGAAAAAVRDGGSATAPATNPTSKGPAHYSRTSEKVAVTRGGRPRAAEGNRTLTVSLED